MEKKSAIENKMLAQKKNYKFFLVIFFFLEPLTAGRIHDLEVGAMDKPDSRGRNLFSPAADWRNCGELKKKKKTPHRHTVFLSFYL